VNVMRRIAQIPTVYRWMVLRQPRLMGLSERLVRWVSRGRFGVLDLAGLPSIQVTAPGRRSGILRTVTVQYVPDGHQLILVGSNWGLPTHPAWSANLQSVSEVTVRQQSQTFTASVRMLAGAEREKAWATVLNYWPSYQVAQERASAREFRLFVLAPIGATGNG
jgi:deazaflavin-dependent oxidoreductase (nitroreductase family)